MILEIRQTVWLMTPKGQGYARFVIDRGDDSDLQWVCFIVEGKAKGEIWTFSNFDVKLLPNVTMGRPL